MTMSPILQSLVEMTGHRDHLRLEVSVVSALQELSGTLEVRALEVFPVNGALHVRPRTWLEGGKWISATAEAPRDMRKVALGTFPALAECLRQREKSACTVLENGHHRLWLPVWLQDKVTSCLEVTQHKPFSNSKIAVIKGVFDVYQNYQSLLDYSERDALTGLFNRKTFDEQFARQATDSEPSSHVEDLLEHSHEDHRCLPPADARHWLAVVDIDHFKLVNDRFGHLYGDEVLILVANILRTSFRSQDRVFRFGGEEFVILLRSATLETAHKVFNRFRTSVEAYEFPQVGQISVSIGFVATDAGAPVEILGAADQALYYAKEHGRNLVCHYTELVQCGELTAKVSNDDVELF